MVSLFAFNNKLKSCCSILFWVKGGFSFKTSCFGHSNNLLSILIMVFLLNIQDKFCRLYCQFSLVSKDSFGSRFKEMDKGVGEESKMEKVFELSLLGQISNWGQWQESHPKVRT